VLLLAAAGFFLLRDNDDNEVVVDDSTTTTEEEETTTTEGPDEDETTTTDESGNEGELAFVEIQDDTGQLTVEVPDYWVEVDGRPIADSQTGAQTPNVQAAPNLNDFRNTVTTSGLSYSLIPSTREVDTTIDFLVQQVGFDRLCTDAGRFDYDDGVFVGRAQQLENCGNVGTTAVFVVANPSDGGNFTVEINFQLTSDEPSEVGDNILATFLVIE